MNRLWRLFGATMFTGPLSQLACMLGSATLQESGVKNSSNSAVIIGGVLTGFVAGGVLTCLPVWTQESSRAYKVAFVTTAITLLLASNLTGPLVGELILKRGTSYKDVVLDEAVGFAIFLALLLLVSGPCYCIASRPGFFSRSVNPPAAREDTALRPLPV